jgi:hypothetical protein
MVESPRLQEPNQLLKFEPSLTTDYGSMNQSSAEQGAAQKPIHISFPQSAGIDRYSDWDVDTRQFTEAATALDKLKGMKSSTDQKPIQTSKEGNRRIQGYFPEIFASIRPETSFKGVHMTRQKNKARSANRKPRSAIGAITKRGLYKRTSKVKRRLKLRASDWIAIAALVWKMFTAMLPYIS